MGAIRFSDGGVDPIESEKLSIYFILEIGNHTLLSGIMLLSMTEMFSYLIS